MIKNICLSLLKFYKRFVSPCFPKACRFYPTCSEYMFGAISKHGVVKGIILGVFRVLRCNPVCKGGYDPVP